MSAENRRMQVSKEGRTPSDVPFGRWLLGQLLLLLRQYFGQMIWATVVIALFHYSSQTIEAFAGHVSIANFLFSVAAHLDWTIKVSIVLSGVTTAALLIEYRRHRKTRERLTKRITTLEKRLDPSRTSSQLTPEGTTRTEDQ